jgi:hypothetical protein
MGRDEVAITGARVSAVNSARESMQRLVNHGATREEVIQIIEEMEKQAKAEALIGFSRRDARDGIAAS